MITPRPGGSLYEQVAAALRERIHDGTLQPGQRIPSERTLQQEHGIARETARRAVAVLRAEGLLEIQRGQGVVVRERQEIEDAEVEAGSTVTARMPISEERAELAIPEGIPVFVVTSVDGRVEVFPADRWRLRWPS